MGSLPHLQTRIPPQEMDIRSFFGGRPSSRAIITHISDSFVHPTRKLPGGGHGESRLYIGNDPASTKRLATKPLKFDFTDYPLKPTYDIPAIPVHEQQGGQDGRRFYVGVKNLSSEHKGHWDAVRKCLLPQTTCLVIKESPDCFVASVKNTGDVDVGMRGANNSTIAIRWLEYESQRTNTSIVHAGNGPEFGLTTEKGYKWPVDGYCAETKTVYEFQGDYFHGNPAKFSGGDLFHGRPYSEKWAKDAAKRKRYEDAGFTYVVMWESDWIEILRRLNTVNV